MQSTRFLAQSMLRQQAASSLLRSRMVPMLRTKPTPTVTRQLRLQASPRMRMPVPKEEHSAHTVSQRLRTLKKIPPELIPLGVVLAVAVVFAGYSMINKLFSDKTLRLTRQGKQSDDH